MRLKRKNLSSFFKDKTGDMSLDLLFVAILVIVVGIGWFFTGYAFDSIATEISSDLTHQEAIDSLNDVHEDYNENMDGLIALLFFGAALFVIISSWFLDSHPVFFVATLIMMTIVISVLVVLANAVGEVVTDPEFASQTADFTMTIFIYSHLVELILGIGFISAVVIYGKWRGF